MSFRIFGTEVSKGIEGQQGPQGIEGPTGDIGLTGPTGPQGIEGQQGPIGPQGIEGQQGPTGPQGIEGQQGPTGPQGIEGQQGPTGPQGIEGQQGPTGVSIEYMKEFRDVVFHTTNNGGTTATVPMVFERIGTTVNAIIPSFLVSIGNTTYSHIIANDVFPTFARPFSINDYAIPILTTASSQKNIGTLLFLRTTNQILIERVIDGTWQSNTINAGLPSYVTFSYICEE